MAKIKASSNRSTKLSSGTNFVGMQKINVGRIQKKKKGNLFKISKEKLNEIKSHNSAHTEANLSIKNHSLNRKTYEEGVSNESTNKSKKMSLQFTNKNGSKQFQEVTEKFSIQDIENKAGAINAAHKRRIEDSQAHDNSIKFKKMQKHKMLDIKQKSSEVVCDTNISNPKKKSKVDGQVSILNGGAAKSSRWQSLQTVQKTLQKKKTLKGTNAKQTAIDINNDINGINALNNSDSDSDEDNTKQDDEACKSYVDDFGFDACEEENLSDENEEEDQEEERILEEAANKKKKVERDTDELQRTVQVLNVNVKTPKKALLVIFKKYGKVESIRYRNVPVKDEKAFKINQIMKGSLDTGRSSMTAFVKFANLEGAIRALQANTTEVQGHHLLVSPSISKTPEQRKDDLKRGCTVMVGNLPYNTEEEPLYRLLSECGPVVSMNIMRRGFKCTGTAFVAFEHREAAAKAVQLPEPKCQGRLLRVVKAVRKAKKPKPGGGRLDTQQSKGVGKQSPAPRPLKGVGKQSPAPRPFVPKGRSRQFAYNRRGTGNSTGGASEKPRHVTRTQMWQQKQRGASSSDKVTQKRQQHITGSPAAQRQQKKKHATVSNKSPKRPKVSKSPGPKGATPGGGAVKVPGFGGQHFDQAQKSSQKKKRWTKDEVKKNQLAKKLLTKAV